MKQMQNWIKKAYNALFGVVLVNNNNKKFLSERILIQNTEQTGIWS